MRLEYDVAIIGLGAMGSATVYNLAKRGLRVAGFEQFLPAHDRGSSHGGTRIIRQAYFEHPDYVPLVLQAYKLWNELERESERKLLLKTGGILIGPPESLLITGALGSAKKNDLKYRLLTNAELREEYPMFQISPTDIALFEQEAGVLFPEECVRAYLERAQELGATLHFNSKVEEWNATDGRVEIKVNGRKIYAKKLIFTAGAWTSKLFHSDFDLPLVVERIVNYYFEPSSNTGAFTSEHLPVFIWDYPGKPFYGIPNVHGDGVKVGFHHSNIMTDPDHVNRKVSNTEIEEIKERLAQAIPSLNGTLLKAKICMYTTTPDEHFVIGLHPNHENIIIASPCSGHGFKFASVIGEILSDLAIQRKTRHSIELFSPIRFKNAKQHITNVN